MAAKKLSKTEITSKLNKKNRTNQVDLVWGSVQGGLLGLIADVFCSITNWRFFGYKVSAWSGLPALAMAPSRKAAVSKGRWGGYGLVTLSLEFAPRAGKWAAGTEFGEKLKDSFGGFVDEWKEDDEEDDIPMGPEGNEGEPEARAPTETAPRPDIPEVRPPPAGIPISSGGGTIFIDDETMRLLNRIGQAA